MRIVFYLIKLIACLHVRLINWTAVTQKSCKSVYNSLHELCLHIQREYSNVARVTGGVFNVIIAISASAFQQLPLGEERVKFCDRAKHKRYLAGERKESLLSIVCYILIIPSELQKDWRHMMLSYSSHARSQWDETNYPQTHKYISFNSR